MQVATSHAPAALFGERLVKLGKLKPVDLERALRAQAEIRQPLGSVLVRLGMLTEQEVAFVLSRHLNVRMALSKDYPSIAIENPGIAINYMRNAEIIPVQSDDNRLIVAMSNPQDEFAKQAICMASGKLIDPLLGLPSEIRANIERLYGAEAIKKDNAGGGDDDFEITSHDNHSDDVEHLKDMASEAPVIRLVNQIMTNAMTQRASDIHIEPFESHLKVRYRIDGVIHEVESPPPQLTPAIISRLKLMARLNIAERRLPQDGRIQLRAQGKEIDMRVSTVPTMHGESVVMRLLDKHSVKLDLNTLGFSDDNLRKVQQQLDAPHGVILVTGPTGSGKTTTLYSALTQLNTPENKVLTVEDPVEYELEGINQIQANPKIGLNFADALRSIVRQDPDIIMIGEMRDVETARIAIQSALTGHLVLSTLHTNDAASGITRLMDMGIEDYLITSTVNGILAQRLVRRLCPQCRESHPVMPEIEQELGLRQYQPEGELRLWRAKGCNACSNTGYKGRSAIHEVLVMDDAIRRRILKHEDAGVLQEQARKGGMRTMYEDGLAKTLKGVTTLEEVLRVAEETLMPTYSYKAITPQGVAKEGTLEAASEAQAAENLNAQGLIPIKISAGKNAATGNNPATASKKPQGLFASKHVSQPDIMALTQQMSTMLKAGLPLDRALGILLEIGDKPPVLELVQGIQNAVRSGKRFADSLEESGKFTRFYVNMVRAGEAGGSIDDALARLVDYMTRAKELRGTVISALIYPAILAFVAVVSIFALLTFVVPQFSSMFADMGAELPTITKVVMGTSATLQEYWWAVLGGFLLILMVAQYILRNEKARTRLDRSMLSWPIVGDLIGKIETARFSRSLGTLLHNGVPLLGALKMAKNTVGNRVMAAAVEESADSLKQGESLTRTLLSKGVFPAYALHMLRVGEETGRMEQLLREVADIYDDEVKTSVKQMLALLEPLLIMIMAVAILLIIGSVLLPMINMADLVK